MIFNRIDTLRNAIEDLEDLGFSHKIIPEIVDQLFNVGEEQKDHKSEDFQEG